jgi:hypothetical protein
VLCGVCPTSKRDFTVVVLAILLLPSGGHPICDRIWQYYSLPVLPIYTA